MSQATEARTVEYRGERIALPVYLDYQATTPVDPRVLEAMLPYFRERFGNPHSVQHGYGWRAEEAVDRARGQVAALIGARPEEIVFTSGATEANNLALRGVLASPLARGRHLVTCDTEHKCVLESAAHLAHEGCEITSLPVGSDGLVDPDALADALGGDTALVSIMLVNNEIGVVQPVAEIGRLCAERGVLLHTDAAQASGKIPFDVDALGVDLLSLTGHKVYGPMGIGALYVRNRPELRLAPLFHGGGQERGLRSGTVPTPLCVGLGEACAIAAQSIPEEGERIGRLRDRLWHGITDGLDGVHLNGDPERRVPHNLNLAFEGVSGADLVPELDALAVSSASACTSATPGPSHVLKALGLGDDLADASLRLSLGRDTTEAEVEFAIEQVVEGLKRLRERR